MQTFIHFATPPGWRERESLPTLQRLHSRPGPQLRTRGPARPQPPARTGRRDDEQPDDDHAAYGLAWWQYAAAAVASVVLAVVCAYRIGTGEDAGRAWAPLVGAAVAFGVAMSGLVDYAKAGAAAVRGGES